MTYPTPDANGTISWNEAVMLAWEDAAVFSRFAVDYAHLYGERIDLGELEAMRSEVAVNAIADLVFS
jgi:hypothetical protein